MNFEREFLLRLASTWLGCRLATMGGTPTGNWQHQPVKVLPLPRVVDARRIRLPGGDGDLLPGSPRMPFREKPTRQGGLRLT